MLADLQKALDQRQADGLLRQRRLLDSPQAEYIETNSQQFLSFCSNDYLGLANHPTLIATMQEATDKAGVGSGASNLITGHHRYHDDLEKQLAQFVNMPAALLFSTGYMANIGALGALAGRGDAIFADKLNHACLNDGSYYSLADFHRFPHNDTEALEKLLKASKARRKLIAADAVFSMDGDVSSLKEITEISEKSNAITVVDDAHGDFVIGKDGKGTPEYFNVAKKIDLYISSLSKGLGSFGGYVASQNNVIDLCINKSKSFKRDIFS